MVITIAFLILLQRWEPRSVPLSHPDWTLIWAGALFVIAAITDAFDGHLARAWNAVTKFGRVMDPFADKMLVLGAFVLLAGPDFQSVNTVDPQAARYHITGIEPWMVVVIISRELLVTSLRGMIEGGGVSFAANAWGKAKMILQSVAIPTIIGMVALFDVRAGTSGRIVIQCAVWLVVVVTAVSSWPYIVRGWRVLQTMGHEEHR